MNLHKMSGVVLAVSLLLMPFTAGAQTTTAPKYGQKNNAQVKKLQQLLKDQGLYSGPVNGNFYAMTQASVKKFQKKYNLKQTGTVDATTSKKIAEVSAATTTTATSSNGTRYTYDSVAAGKAAGSLVVPPGVDPTKLALGDNKYSLTEAKKGYIYACKVDSGGGAQGNPPWISGTTWDATGKLQVSGNVAWTNATYSMSTNGTTRTFTGNGLPTDHNTGTYPIQSSDAVHAYDGNPNSIKSQSLSISVPFTPTLASKPTCTGGGIVAISVSGVPIFNGFDAAMRDAVAHEAQDKCDGHPQVSGQYHYHNVSRCLPDTKSGPNGSSDLIGYALDGFGLYGPYGPNGKVYTNADLDECHGITSDIMWEGKKVSMYHYVATLEFPYTLGCFKGSPTNANGGGGQGQGGQMGGQQGQGMQNGQGMKCGLLMQGSTTPPGQNMQNIGTPPGQGMMGTGTPPGRGMQDGQGGCPPPPMGQYGSGTPQGGMPPQQRY